MNEKLECYLKDSIDSDHVIEFLKKIYIFLC